MELEMAPDERQAYTRRRTIRLLAGLFVAVLAVLTLYSNTLHSLGLPKVTTETPAHGSFRATFAGSAALRPVEQAELSHPDGWSVSN